MFDPDPSDAEHSGRVAAPLADRMRPRRADEVEGHEPLLAPGGLLGHVLAGGLRTSLVLWGPPGCGKTSLARLLAQRADLEFEALSAVTSGVKDVREVIERARRRREQGRGTLLFVDEIHRFNRAQQDAFLPHVEDGTIVLVGATTENPGFSLIGALLSRVRVVRLESLAPAALERILDRALADKERGLGGGVGVAPEARAALVELAGGDARRLLDVLESAVHLAGGVTARRTHVLEAAQSRAVGYDRSGDDRYDLLSALHKSLRGSDVDASLFWMGRMLEAGEDPRVVLRRIVAMASEDVGLADPAALGVAVNAVAAVEFLGQPEGELALTQAVIHLATAPKSNSVVRALKAARELARRHVDLPVPLHLRNAPTAVARQLGHGANYHYPHDFPHSVVRQHYLPDALRGHILYTPTQVGAERETARRLHWWRQQQGEVTPDPEAADPEAGNATSPP